MEKETKNTVRYQENPTRGEPSIIGTLYLQKWAIMGEDERFPRELNITISTP